MRWREYRCQLQNGAASGQGRFSEELSFPYEAHVAGLKPILIVFDSTPSTLLGKLKAKYVEEGGAYAIGEDAWNMLSDRAGDEMGKFIVKYIKPPISKMEDANINLPQDIQLSVASEKLSIQDTCGNKYQIPRITITE